MLQIVSATFRNFRALRDVTIPLSRKTVLVGPNNAGKTSVLQGLEHALGVGRRAYVFDERDVSEGVDPTDGFEIRIEFGPAAGDLFDGDETALFGNHVDVVAGKHRVYVVVEGRQDEESVFRTRLRFAKSDGADDGWVSAAERQVLGILLLPAVREARHEFGERGGLWARLGGDPNLTPEGKEQLERYGFDVGEQIVQSILGPDVADDVKASVVSLVASVLYADEAGGSIAFSSIPTDLSQALRSVEVRIASPHQASGKRVSDQSVGLQSVAMFGLFGAYARATGAQVVAIGVEEPEAHLHPHATRALVRHLDGLGMQTVVTTHSTSVTDAADPRTIVRLRRRGMVTTAHTVAAGSISDAEARTIGKLVSDVGSDFVFARAVLLAEGSSERLALPVFARQLGHDFDTLGVTVVPVLGNAFGAFARLLGENGLAVPFAAVTDLDSAVGLIRTAKREGLVAATVDEADLGAAAAAGRPAGVFWWTIGDFEQVLFNGGAGELYVDAIAEMYGAGHLVRFSRGSGVDLPPDPGADQAFLHQVLRSRVSKPLLAQRVAEMFGERAIDPPAEVQVVVNYVSELARNEVKLAVGEPPPPVGP